MRVAKDIAISPDGDFIIRDHDLAVAKEGEFQLQSIINRIKAVRINWRLDHIGADMEDIIGMPNSPDTAQLTIDKITFALTEDDLIDKKDIYIRPVPISKTTILFFLFVNSPYFAQPISLEIGLDLSSGVIKVMEV